MGILFPPGEIDGWAVPIIVVTADTGKRIKSLLASYQSCGVEGLVDIEPHPLPSELVDVWLTILGHPEMRTTGHGFKWDT